MTSTDRQTPVTVVVNGEARRLVGHVTLLNLLETLDLDPRGVVVELNQEIVRRPQLEHTRLQEGDRVELVHFVGGG